MKILSELISNLDIIEINRNQSLEISSLHFDSRLVERGSLFVAVKGTAQDGHDFINEAIDRGAVAVIYDRDSVEEKSNTTYVRVKDSQTALALLAQNFYNHPSKKLNLVGVTGTNGKTTIATMLFNLFEALGYSCALLSTIENKIGKSVY